MGAGRRSLGQRLEGDERDRRALRLLAGEDRLAGELGLLAQGDEEIEARLDGRPLVVQVLAVERIARLETEGVPAAQAARLETRFLATRQERFPEIVRRADRAKISKPSSPV